MGTNGSQILSLQDKVGIVRLAAKSFADIRHPYLNYQTTNESGNFRVEYK
jgi:hypothetical protein